MSHFSSAECSEVMSRRTQKESGGERVAAKSRPMMNLIARSSERAPSALSFSSSGGLGKTRQESQSPLSAKAEMYDRTGKPVVCRDISHAQGARKTSRSQEIETRSLMKKLWIMIERWHPLSAVTQVTSQEPPKHVPLMKAQPSNVGDETNHDRTEQPVVGRDASH